MTAKPTTIKRRLGRRGSILLSSLVLLVLIASILTIIQQRAFSSIAVLARLENSNLTHIHTASIKERLRLPLAATALSKNTPIAISLNGEPLTFQFAQDTWQAMIYDKNGLIDVYLATPVVTSLLQVPGFEQDKEAALSNLPTGHRFATLEQTLARYGISKDDRQRIMPLVTQSSNDRRLNVSHVPARLRASAAQLPSSEQMTAQSTLFRVVITKMRQE